MKKVTTSNKVLSVLFIICTILLIVYSCKKTYESGPAVSLRTKMSRITGKWRLVSMEGVPRLNSEVEQYMELTKDEISDGVYEIYYTNFQEQFCPGDKDSLFTCSGTWRFFDGAYGACDIMEYLEKKEGLFTTMSCCDSLDTIIDTRNSWKIKRLSNKELIIRAEYCSDFVLSCYYNSMFLFFNGLKFLFLSDFVQ
ncbi:MAG: hypothetical protein KJ607_06370 [Bacteroidetes bacterium]|nr:hypothetical protein [Bacteroidota bacterium]